MEITEDKIITWDEIKENYSDEWVVLANPVFEGLKVVTGIVIAHHRDKRVASIMGGEQRAGYNKFTLTFTGQQASRSHVGLLKTRKQTT